MYSVYVQASLLFALKSSHLVNHDESVISTSTRHVLVPISCTTTMRSSQTAVKLCKICFTFCSSRDSNDFGTKKYRFRLFVDGFKTVERKICLSTTRSTAARRVRGAQGSHHSTRTWAKFSRRTLPGFPNTSSEN